MGPKVFGAYRDAPDLVLTDQKFKQRWKEDKNGLYARLKAIVATGRKNITRLNGGIPPSTSNFVPPVIFERKYDLERAMEGIVPELGVSSRDPPSWNVNVANHLDESHTEDA